MVEKKVVVDGLRLSYSGPFDVVEFYKAIEDWVSEKGMQRELKKKLEHVTPDGKKLEWFAECWKDLADYAKSVVRVRALFNNVKDIEIVRDKEKRKLNYGNVLIIFDGFLETDIEARWQQKPWFYFLRAIVDKFIYKFWTEKFDGGIRKDVYELHGRLKKFFELYK